MRGLDASSGAREARPGSHATGVACATRVSLARPGARALIRASVAPRATAHAATATDPPTLSRARHWATRGAGACASATARRRRPCLAKGVRAPVPGAMRALARTPDWPATMRPASKNRQQAFFLRHTSPRAREGQACWLTLLLDDEGRANEDATAESETDSLGILCAPSKMFEMCRELCAVRRMHAPTGTTAVAAALSFVKEMPLPSCGSRASQPRSAPV